MILMAYRHGLRAAEIVDLRWDQVELGRNAALHVRRVKQGLPSVHPLPGDEMRALRDQIIKWNEGATVDFDRSKPTVRDQFVDFGAAQPREATGFSDAHRKWREWKSFFVHLSSRSARGLRRACAVMDARKWRASQRG